MVKRWIGETKVTMLSSASLINMTTYKNVNRGYMKLRVWQDAKQLYGLTWKIFGKLDFKLDKIVKNQIASVDSVHRNIAEGYGRRSLVDYLRFLDYALASLGESVSAISVYNDAGHIRETQFEEWNDLSYKLENGLIRLVTSLQQKQSREDWSDNFLDKDSRTITGRSS